ncbi:MAG: hypothetical protein J7K73_00930 [Nanoarchaeota archaeon]|nr:hypothetical protein [Nanoarchaeota archaeon]
MAVIEKVFYTENKSIFDNDALKMLGFKYESASTLGVDKPGYFMIIKAEEDEFSKEAVKEALKDAEEISGEEKDKILNKFKELEESAASGFAMFG